MCAAASLKLPYAAGSATLFEAQLAEPFARQEENDEHYR
jgi:hypothetical protein